MLYMGFTAWFEGVEVGCSRSGLRWYSLCLSIGLILLTCMILKSAYEVGSYISYAFT